MNQPVPSLDLTKVGPSADIIRPETDRSSSSTTPMATPNVTLSTTENEWDSDLTSKAAKSVVAAPRLTAHNRLPDIRGRTCNVGLGESLKGAWLQHAPPYAHTSATALC